MTISENHSDAEPYATPSESPTFADGDRKWVSMQTLLILSLYALLAFAAAFSVFHYDNVTAYYVSSIVFAILATSWAINDSRLRERTFHPVLRMLHLLFCPISLVIYLICTRGFRGLGLAALHSVAMIAVANAAFYFVFYAIYFTGYWDLFDPIYFDS
ncbi:hypothetical protein SAMN06265222_12521 [Neorhodopirellula lusitana]|uniref:Uncharacterized protein n=1 Tax=Neorhodopirellula lusitana TaxID=445327 RepID=A0ABY1QT72_9BACT|nr:hypothetical protein [Neorhodopirellula lusitana]SMP78266.1 hypothetical protein SAMN06265222_12521 [Neorhodopirellula lusitana]